MEDSITENRKARRREISKRYYARNKRECQSRTSAWAKENKERVAECKRLRYAADPEAAREKRRAYYRKNAEIERERAKQYQREHAAETKESKRAWYEGHKDHNRNYAHKRRAKVRGVEGGHFTDAEFQKVCEDTGNKCLCCRTKGVPLTADHVIPLGPPHSDEIGNIQPLCLSCNCKKHTKTTDYR